LSFLNCLNLTMDGVPGFVDSNGQFAEEEIRRVTTWWQKTCGSFPRCSFMELKFRLPDNLAAGVCNVKIRSHGEESNSGPIRIRN